MATCPKVPKVSVKVNHIFFLAHANNYSVKVLCDHVQVKSAKGPRLCLVNLFKSDLSLGCLQAAHRGHWFIRKTDENSKMDWPSLRKSRGSAGQWPEFMFLPFSWLLMCLQSLKECKKVAWGFDKHGRDLRKHVEGGKEGKTIRNEKDLGMPLRLIAPWKLLKSWAAFFLSQQSAVSVRGKGFSSWRTQCLMWRPYQLEHFQKIFYQAISSPRHSFHLPLTPQKPDSSVE